MTKTTLERTLTSSFLLLAFALMANTPHVSVKSGFAQTIYASLKSKCYSWLVPTNQAPPPTCILLQNQGFDSNLSQWTKSGSVSATTDSYAGNWAAAITGFYAYILQSQSGIVPGNIYTVTAHAKISGSPWWALVGIRFKNSSSSILSESTVLVGSTGYTQYSISATAPVNAFYVEVFAQKFGGGSFIVDEFCLTETIPVIANCVLAENPGFENGLINWLTSGGTVTNTANPYTGASAVQIISNGAKLYQKLGIYAGQTYELTAWSKVTGQPTKAEIALTWRDINNNAISDIIQPVLNSVTQYQKFSLKGKAPNNAVYAEISFYKEGSSSYSLIADDVCFSLTNPLGGNNFDISCGCSDNLSTNSGFEESSITTFPYTFEGKPVAALSNGNNTGIKPWSSTSASPYIFYVKDSPGTVNNPEGDYFMWLPGKNDKWISNTHFSNNFLLEDGESYTFCFYAASWAGSFNGSGLPDGGSKPQTAGIINLDINFNSGLKTAGSWAVPASASFSDLSWTKFQYSFVYNTKDPISSFTLTSNRTNVGVAIDAVALSKVNCPQRINCGPGGLNYDRWGGITGANVSALLTDPDFPNNWDETGTLTSFQGPTNYSNDFGTRVYGFIVPPATGNYTFNVTSDEYARLLLSTDSTFIKKIKIADVPGFTNPTEHTKYSQQTSSTINLQAGKKYYVELLHKESNGNDHFAVYWKTPSNSTWTIIPGSVLSPICHNEICYNGRDDDFDGLADCQDADCSSGLNGTFSVTDENCNNNGGTIDLQLSGTDLPLNYRWSDMMETAWWTFERSTVDASGNSNHDNGISGNIMYSTDRVQGRYSAYFNGSTYIRYSVDNGFMEKSFSKLTVSLWVKPDDLSSIKTIFDEGGSTGGTGLAIRLSNNLLVAGVRNGSTLFSDASLTFPNDGQWHHIGVVFNNGQFTAYLDGVAGQTLTANFTSLGNHGNNGGIGASISGSVLNSDGTYYKGSIDDVRYFFEQALSAAQIADLAANNGDRSDLIAGNYSVIISSASGCSATENMTVSSSTNHTDGGTINGDEVVCTASFDPSLINNVALPSGGSPGTTEYQWQRSTNGGASWSNISGATSSTYDPPVISATTWYRRGGRLVPCNDWVYSNTVTKTITVNYTDAGAISGDESTCGGFDPGLITSESPPSGGNNGTLEYQWEKSTDDGGTWAVIAGGNTAAYDPDYITQTAKYRRGARRSPCASYLYSNEITKMVVVNHDDPGIIVGNESQCGSYDPDVIGSVSVPSGGSGGTLQYQWQSSTNNGSTWTDVSGASAETFNPTTIVSTTMYRRGARLSPCSNFIYSNTILKEVVNNFTAGGIIAGEQAVCGTYDASIITSNSLPSGGVDGAIIYRWQQSTDGGANWTVITGADSVIYDPPVLTETTLFRRQARRSPCPAWINSNTVTKTVKEIPPAIITTYPIETNGYICEWVDYGYLATDAGSGVTYAWDFGAYATPVSATGPGFHTISYNVPNNVAATTVTAQLTVSKNGCQAVDTKVYSVRPQIVVTSINTSNPSSCSTSDGSISVTASFPSGANIEASINGGSTWVSPPLDFTGLPAGSYPLQLRYTGGECGINWGSVVLTEPAAIEAGIIPSVTSVCTGLTVSFEATVQNAGNPTFNWNFGQNASPATATGQGPHQVNYASGGLKVISLTVQDGFCSDVVDTVLTVVSNFTAGGSITGDEYLCNESTGSVIGSSSLPSGGFGGTTEFQWEKRQGDGAGGWLAWTDIGGATAESYSPGTISATTEYRRKARRTPCAPWVFSNVVAKTISAAPAPVNDLYTSACPGVFFYENVSINDGNLTNPVYAVLVPPTNGTLDMDPDGDFIYTPNSAFCGSDQFTYQICNNGTSCCATATVTIDLSDNEVPVMQNIPASMTLQCDDEVPLPPIVNAWENCQSVTLALDEASTQGLLDSCSVYNFTKSRIWTAKDYCGNTASDQQLITIEDSTPPGIYRIYTMPNGKKMVAGVLQNVSQHWKTVRLPVQFSTVPQIFTQVVTKNDNAAVVTRLRNVSASQFQMRLQEEEYSDGMHGVESVAWMAIESGANTTGLKYEVGSKLISSTPVLVNFLQSYTSTGLIGSIQTFNENNPASLRFNSITSTAAAVFCQEETSLDPETNHGFEKVGFIAIGGAGNITSQSGEVIGETGSIAVNHNFSTVNLTHVYHNPVVIMGGITMNDNAPATIRVKNVSPSSFSVQIDEWEYLDSLHGTETLAYWVVEGSVPFDRIVECSAIPPIPAIGTELIGKDNCDASISLTVSESPFAFDCQNDTLFTRTFSVQDECGNYTSYTQAFILKDTTPPAFSVPADVTISCTADKDNRAITGDVTNESDNCAVGLNAVYTDNMGYLNGCSGYILRVWSLSDLCGNTTVKFQRIDVFNENDADGDGIYDPFDLDDDNDGIPDADEGTGDFDGDGIPDSLDLDSDNDGIPDRIEAGFFDKNGDGIVDSFGQPDWDIDHDGLADENDANPNNPSLLASDNFNPFTAARDRDGDGRPNWLDLDSDNDGIPDLIEAGGVDTDGNGVIDYPVPGVPTSLQDADGDGFYDAYDPDDDSSFGLDQPNDVLIKYSSSGYAGGLSTYHPDQDGDGVPDFYDLDADNDGIPDLIEAGGVDTDGNGRIDPAEFSDANLNGFNDTYESLPLVYTDEDGSPEDGRPEDNNGNRTAYESADLDADGIPNYRDWDSDSDGIPDIVETGYHSLDPNKDGKIDNFIDNNADGFHDVSAGKIFTDPDGGTDDGRPEDDADADSSAYNAVLADGTFGRANGEPDLDDDGDNFPNFLDTDSDNDLLDDALEDKNGNGLTDAGETNYLHPDTDNDGILDGIEDANKNGDFDLGLETNPLDSDTDDDNINDGAEDTNKNGVKDPGESDPKDPCDPTLGSSCIGVKLSLKIKLFGALLENGGSPLMRDDLRQKNYIPTKEPYSGFANFRHRSNGGGETVNSSIFNVTGNNAIVDWVFIELRLASTPNQIVATRSALIQRDGDVVDTDGTSPVFFNLAPTGNYFVAIRHRNHLGVSTQNPYFLSPASTSIDFTNPETPTHGNHSQVLVNNELAMWPGDLNEDRKVIYQGPANDVLPMFFHIIINDLNTLQLANYVSHGYLNMDVNLDGIVLFQGPNNDRSKLLFYSVLNTPENSNLLANFVVVEKLP